MGIIKIGENEQLKPNKKEKVFLLDIIIKAAEEELRNVPVRLDEGNKCTFTFNHEFGFYNITNRPMILTHKNIGRIIKREFAKQSEKTADEKHKS